MRLTLFWLLCILAILSACAWAEDNESEVRKRFESRFWLFQVHGVDLIVTGTVGPLQKKAGGLEYEEASVSIDQALWGNHQGSTVSVRQFLQCCDADPSPPRLATGSTGLLVLEHARNQKLRRLERIVKIDPNGITAQNKEKALRNITSDASLDYYVAVAFYSVEKAPQMGEFVGRFISAASETEEGDYQEKAWDIYLWGLSTRDACVQSHSACGIDGAVLSKWQVTCSTTNAQLIGFLNNPGVSVKQPLSYALIDRARLSQNEQDKEAVRNLLGNSCESTAAKHVLMVLGESDRRELFREWNLMDSATTCINYWLKQGNDDERGQFGLLAADLGLELCGPAVAAELETALSAISNMAKFTDNGDDAQETLLRTWSPDYLEKQKLILILASALRRLNSHVPRAQEILGRVEAWQQGE